MRCFRHRIPFRNGGRIFGGVSRKRHLFPAPYPAPRRPPANWGKAEADSFFGECRLPSALRSCRISRAGKFGPNAQKDTELGQLKKTLHLRACQGESSTEVGAAATQVTSFPRVRPALASGSIAG